MMTTDSLKSSIKIMFELSGYHVNEHITEENNELYIFKENSHASLLITSLPPGKQFKVAKSRYSTPIYIDHKNLLEIEDVYEPIVEAIQKCLMEELL